MKLGLLSLVVLLGISCGQADPDPPQGRLLVVQRVHLLPMDRERVLRDQTVQIRDGVIVAIEPSRDTVWPQDATIVDGAGRFLIPGLIDAHVHLNSSERDDHLVLYLAHGVTTVQSMHGSPRHLELRARVERGELLGPRVLTTGPTTASRRVRTPDAAARLVAEQRAAGYDAIKMYGDGANAMTRETYARLIASAHNAGMRVVGHAPRNLPFDLVLENRQHSIDHMEEVVYTHAPFVAALYPLLEVQFRRVELDDAMRGLVAEFPGVGARITPGMLDRLAGRARDAGLAVTPTLVAFETIWRQTTSAYDTLLEDPSLETISPSTRNGWGPERNRYRSGWADRLDTVEVILRHSLELQKRLVHSFHRAGVPILVGTDAPLTFVYPGRAVHRELELLVECGLTPYQALRAATVVPAEVLRLGQGSGRVAVGSRADLVLLEANPLEEIGHLARIAGVVAAGRWHPRGELQRRRSELAAAYAQTP